MSVHVYFYLFMDLDKPPCVFLSVHMCENAFTQFLLLHCFVVVVCFFVICSLQVFEFTICLNIKLSQENLAATPFIKNTPVKHLFISTSHTPLSPLSLLFPVETLDGLPF